MKKEKKKGGKRKEGREEGVGKGLGISVQERMELKKAEAE